MTTSNHARRRPAGIRMLAIAGAVLLGATAMAGCSNGRPPAKGATTIRTGGVDVHAISRKPKKPISAAPTVLFLHGQSYTSRIWDDRGILDAVTKAGYPVVAVDLPGYGDTDEPKSWSKGRSSLDDGRWLRGLINKLGGPEQVVLVSPSMSGRFSLSYLAGFSLDPLAGFVPVAPVGSDEFRRPWPDLNAMTVPIPALVIWGSKDDTFSSPQADRMLQELVSGVDGTAKEIPGASHACYDDHPKQFTAALLTFLKGRASGPPEG